MHKLKKRILDFPLSFVAFFMKKDATNGRSLLSTSVPLTILGRISSKLFIFLHLHRPEVLFESLSEVLFEFPTESLSEVDVTITE